MIIFFYILISHIFMNDKKTFRLIPLINQYVQIMLGMFITLSPFILFEFRHNFLNTKGILTFIFGNTVSYATNSNFFQIIFQVYFRIFERLVFNFPASGMSGHLSWQLIIFAASAMTLSVLSIIILYLNRNKYVTLIIGLWLSLGTILFGFYKKDIYDYLFTFIFPLPFLLIGNLLSFIYDFPKQNIKKISRFYFKIISMLLFLILVIINIPNTPLLFQPNHQKDQARKIAQFVISNSDDKPFNFALLSKGNSDYEYRYFMEMFNHSPVTIENLEKDPLRKSVTRQLFIVCEDINCHPLGNSLWEVAGFGRAEIANEWNFSVVKIYKLIPYKK